MLKIVIPAIEPDQKTRSVPCRVIIIMNASEPYPVPDPLFF